MRIQVLCGFVPWTSDYHKWWSWLTTGRQCWHLCWGHQIDFLLRKIELLLWQLIMSLYISFFWHTVRSIAKSTKRSRTIRSLITTTCHVSLSIALSLPTCPTKIKTLMKECFFRSIQIICNGPSHSSLDLFLICATSILDIYSHFISYIILGWNYIHLSIAFLLCSSYGICPVIA